ncbi:transcriptional regulator [Vibrio sp. JCM 19236]|nr:transcriptional regulator [Vibrio sp. JCM 19236]
MKRVLDDLSVFCAVVEKGTLKGASEALAIPHSTVSRRIESLEKSLGLTLLHRTTREVRVSQRGQQLYDDCSPMLESIQGSIDLAVEEEVEFRGKLKVSMPLRAGIDFLGSWLIDFASTHPELDLEVSLSNTNKNLVQDEIDLAFRVGPLMDSSAIALHLWDIPYQVVAHRNYLVEHEITGDCINKQCLEKMPSVVTKPALSWSFLDHEKQEVRLTPNAGLTLDDLGLALHAVKSGKYMAMLPKSMIDSDDLVDVTVEGLVPRTRIMYAYYLGRRHAQSQISTS